MNRIEKNNSGKINVFFKLYIISTLFLGTSVLSFLHLPNNQDSFWFCMHYIALPFLLLAYFSMKHEKCSRIEQITILISILFLLINRVILMRSASLGFMVNILYEPIILLSILLSINKSMRLFIKKTLIIFFVIECTVGIYEAITEQLIFMQNKEIYEVGEFGVISIRAYSLHGHPLSNAALVVPLSVIFLFSENDAKLRYFLYLLGVLAVFAFNTRSALLLMLLAFCIYFIYNLKASLWKMLFISGIIIIPFVIIALPYFESLGLGNRFSIAIDSDDGSSMARVIILSRVFNMNWIDLMFGISPEEIKGLLKTTGLVAVENSILNVILAWGVPFALIYFVCIYKMFEKFRLWVGILTFYVFGIIFLLLLNVNNVIQSFTPLIPVCFMSLCAFPNKTNIKTTSLL